jgi:hypothetical protein
MMTNTSLKILKLLVIIDLILAAGSIIFFDINMLYNTQIGFVSASFVMIGSMFSYRRMVKARIEHNIITTDDSKDVIDKLEDPHDLYSEDIVDDPDVDIREAIKDEKQRFKANRRSVFQVIKDTKGALSIYRVSAYILLVLGFLYLNRHGILYIPGYLFSLSLPMIVIVTVLVKDKENQTQDSVK